MQDNRETLKNWVGFAREQGQGKRGMFAPRLSLWREIGAEDFPARRLCVKPEDAQPSFSCDIKGLDTYQIAVYNGFVAGEKGRNLLFPDRKAELGGSPCVCRMEDLTDPQEIEKIESCFNEKVPVAAHVPENGTQVRDTAGFAQGTPDTDTLQIKRLNLSLSPETLIVWIPAGCRLEKPLQIVNLCHGREPLFVQPHCRILLGQGAGLSLVHCTDSHIQSDVLANALTEIHMAPSSVLEFIQMQNVGDQCRIFHHIDAHLQADARLTLHRLTLNGGMSGNSTEINLSEPGARAQVFGLYLQDKMQKVDNRVKINHFAPNTYSRELFKGVMDDTAEAGFKGHVFVSPQAQQTEAYQSCRNLLVSPKAQVYAKPYLEIYADDVQCNHGVTVGQLDEDALFYMRCRGISAESARRLLMRAYADEILKEIGVEEIRLWLTSLVKRRFSGQLQACQDCVLSCTGGEC